MEDEREKEQKDKNKRQREQTKKAKEAARVQEYQDALRYVEGRNNTEAAIPIMENVDDTLLDDDCEIDIEIFDDFLADDI